MRKPKFYVWLIYTSNFESYGLFKIYEIKMIKLSEGDVLVLCVQS